MNDFDLKINNYIEESIKEIEKDKNLTFCKLISNNLKTEIHCNSILCSKKLLEFSKTFNNLFNDSNCENKLNVYVTQENKILESMKEIFINDNWEKNEAITNFNIATRNTSEAKCSKDENYYIMRCYEYFYYIYNKKSNKCLMVIQNEKKALTMVNILLLTPYLLYGDLYAVHGGLVSDGKNNILFSNSSLGGKTTFAILFLTNGWKIVTEETTYITKEGKILDYNIRNYFNIRIGTYLEFKDFFKNKNIINEYFLSMEHASKEKLFDFEKNEQMSIDFNDLCNEKINLLTNKITHTLKVSINKNANALKIIESDTLQIVDKFLELSLAPTVMLFKELVKFDTLDENKRKIELNNIFKNVKSYDLVTNFEYRKNYKNIINSINIK